ncbi:MAG: TIM barrel protein [Treponema sp.]|jgi:hydroxypyruvate isomerase|nr:TIM barrel protein [Treponema sp.]
MCFSVCIDAVFRGLDPLAALEKVREAGFAEYEFWGWWNKDIEALKARASLLSLKCRCLCVQNIGLTDPDRRGVYLAALKDTIEAAKKLGAPCIISQLGMDTGAARAFQHRAIVAGLKAAAAPLEDSGLVLLAEPLNGRVNHTGTYLESSDEGFELIEEAGSKNIRLLFDIYHQQITEGDIISRISAHIDLIGHFHAAGVPGRHELFLGELDYGRIFKAIDTLGYTGAVGLEYFPEKIAAGAGDGELALESLKTTGRHYELF